MAGDINDVKALLQSCSNSVSTRQQNPAMLTIKVHLNLTVLRAADQHKVALHVLHAQDIGQMRSYLSAIDILADDHHAAEASNSRTFSENC